MKKATKQTKTIENRPVLLGIWHKVEQMP